MLDKRLSTIPNFQRTRGALRLLARVTRSLWERKPEGANLIRLDHVDLSERDIAEDLSSRLDRATFDAVIRADVCSQPGGELSHSELVDQQMGAGYARRLAIAAYLFSLTQDVPGVTAGELVGSILAPGDDPNVAVKALDTLERSAWYLHADLRGFPVGLRLMSLAARPAQRATNVSSGTRKGLVELHPGCWLPASTASSCRHECDTDLPAAT